MTKLINRTLILVFLFLNLTTQVIAQEPAPSLRSSALRLIDGLDHSSMLSQDARKAMAEWFCENRKYDQALEQVTNLPTSEKLGLVTFIAKSAVDAREKKTADKILAAAFSILTKHGTDDVFFNGVTDLAELALRNGDFEVASKFVSMLGQDSVKKSKALLTLARSRADSSDRKAAVALVEESLSQTSGFGEDEKDEVIGITAGAAHIFASVGDLDRAKDLAATANAALLIQNRANGEDRTAVASLFVALGNVTQAVGMVELLDADRKMSAFAMLSQFCKDQQMVRSLLERSRELTLATKKDSYLRSTKLSDLVSAYLKADRVDEAFELLPKIRDPYYLHTSAVAVANVLRKSGRIDEAESALDVATKVAQDIMSEKSDDIPSHASFSKVGSKSGILSRLVENYIAIGSLQRAELAAKSIDHPQFQSSAIARVALAYVQKQERAKAQSLFNRALALSSTAKKYNHDRGREDGLFNVALALNEAGFSNESSSAIHRFLEAVKKNNSVEQYLGYLFILGDVAESNGTSLSPKSQALLRQIELQEIEDKW